MIIDESHSAKNIKFYSDLTLIIPTSTRGQDRCRSIALELYNPIKRLLEDAVDLESQTTLSQSISSSFKNQDI